MDPVERVEQFKQLQQMIADDVPYVIMCQIDNSYGVNDSVNMNPRLDDVWNLVNIRAA
jgi:peptide/nickel transport system substrate-binding protein